MFLIISKFIIFPLYGAALYRWRGAAHKWKKYFPRPFNQIVFALPYAYVCYDVISWWCLFIIIPTTLGLLTGHGKFMDLGSWKKDAEDETLEFLIKPLEGKISNYWYDVLGMGITGLAVTLAAGIVLASPLLALSGLLKAPAYMIGRNTEEGEFLTGLLLYFVLVFYL